MKKTAPAMVLALVLNCCATAESPPPSTTAAGSTTSTTLTVTTSPEIDQFAFVRAVDDSEMRYDVATMLTGEEAIEAAQADGVLEEGEILPNDFYISNPEPDEAVVTLDPEGSYILIGFDENGALVDRQVPLDELVAVLNGNNSEEFYGIIPGDVPMILTINGDTVVAARQQYLP